MATLAEFHARQAEDWPRARAELASGRKTSHWIWWIVPQLACLGRSDRARHYGLRDLAEAQSYLDDPVLRGRLEEVARLVLVQDAPPSDIFGDVDAMKLRSSMTLFERAQGAPKIVSDVLDRCFAGSRCETTLKALED